MTEVSKGYTATQNTRPMFFRGEKNCPLSGAGAPEIDYKNVKFMMRFLSERGRILPSRITSVSTSKQRALKVAIKRARILALLPFAHK